eukprot:EG_transcript_29718
MMISWHLVLASFYGIFEFLKRGLIVALAKDAIAKALNSIEIKAPTRALYSVQAVHWLAVDGLDFVWQTDRTFLRNSIFPTHSPCFISYFLHDEKLSVKEVKVLSGKSLS